MAGKSESTVYRIPVLSIRENDFSVRELPLTEVTREQFEGAVPWRKFRFDRGQKHLPGHYWSATMRAHVGYESRLELSCLLFEDFDPSVTWIMSQPFKLVAERGSAVGRHVPDFLLERRDGTICVVDVKPAHRLASAEVAESLEWCRQHIEGRGWEYRVESEPDPVTLANVRFLAGYRRSFLFPTAEVEAATGSVDCPMPLGRAVRAVERGTGDAARARALVLHLLWLQVLVTDLSAPLGTTSMVERP